MDFGKTDRKLGRGQIWYSAAGALISGNGSLANVGSHGNYWSCTPSDTREYGDNRAYTIEIYYDGLVRPSYDYYYRSCGHSVRCISE